MENKKNKRKGSNKPSIQQRRSLLQQIKAQTRNISSQQHELRGEALIEDEWLSCQVDVNKLVQKTRSKGVTFSPDEAWPKEPSDDDNDCKDIKPTQQCEIVNEEFVPDPTSVKEDENEFKYDPTSNISEEWVIEKQLCRGCHAEGDFVSLQAKDPLEGTSYEDMLANCSDIKLLECDCVDDLALRALCMQCCGRLRDAYAFCRQVRTSEVRFRDLYNKNLIRVTGVATIKIEVKVEPSETTDSSDGIKVDENATNIEVNGESIKKEPKTKKKAASKKKEIEIPAKPPRKRRKPGDGPRRTVLTERSTLIGDKYKCKQCDRIFSKQCFYVHNKREHSEVPFDCQLCKKPFQTEIQLKAHKLESHNIEYRMKCNGCDKIFKTPRGLRLHKNTYHMIGEIVKCSMCDYESHSKFSLQRHMVKHKTVKDYHCKYCKKAFLRKSNLTSHERIHTGDKRKKCEECGQAFVQKASLNYHMMKYHPEVKF